MLSELRTFLAVVRYGSFAKAGEHIGLTQGAVSAQIQRLEQHVDLLLFDRSARRATLTLEGREVHSRAEHIVNAMQQLGNMDYSDGEQGTVVLGAITSAQQSWLIDALAAFRAEYARIALRVIPGDSLNIIAQVDTGDMDLAVMVKPPYTLPPDVTWHTLLQEPFVLIASEYHPGTEWQELLQNAPFVRYVRTSFGGRRIEQFLRQHRLVVQDAVELDEIGGLIRAVEKGIGVGIVPVTAAHFPFPAGVRMLPLGKHAFSREIGIAERGTLTHPLLTRRLITLLRHSATASAIALPDTTVD